MQLEYLISPDVLYWENQIADGQEKLKAATEAVKQTPTDATAAAAVQKETAFLDFANDKLAEAWKEYYKTYVPATFGIKQDLDVDTYNVPSDLEVTKARLALKDAKRALQESKEFYEALKSGAMPADSANDSILKVKKAQENLKEAQANLDGSRITAPFTGTVMEVNIAGGDVVAMGGSGTSDRASSGGATTVVTDPLLAALTGGASSTDSSSSSSNPTGDALSAAGVIVVADTSQPYLEVNWNESDWPLLKVGNEVQITFDDRQDKVFTGTITEIDRQVHTTSESTTIFGEVSLDTPFAELGLPVGASASVEVIAQRADNALLIPLEALHKTDSGQTMVFVVQNGKVELRQVEVGLSSDAYAEITSGLEAGEVVTTGTVATQ
jgi:multidrug efflux pump subunit AcrA (membrane-fusion protein)